MDDKIKLKEEKEAMMVCALSLALKSSISWYYVDHKLNVIGILM